MTSNPPKSTSLPYWRRRMKSRRRAVALRRGKRRATSYRGSLISTMVQVSPRWVGLKGTRLSATEGA